MVQKYFLHILLFFYLFGSFASATHIHHNNALKSHSDCKVCIVVKNLHSADTPLLYTFDNILFYHISISEPKDSCYISQILKGYNSQAPPTFS